jgi:hypothetical protein
MKLEGVVEWWEDAYYKGGCFTFEGSLLFRALDFRLKEATDNVTCNSRKEIRTWQALNFIAIPASSVKLRREDY